MTSDPDDYDLRERRRIEDDRRGRRTDERSDAADADGPSDESSPGRRGEESPGRPHRFRRDRNDRRRERHDSGQRDGAQDREESSRDARRRNGKRRRSDRQAEPSNDGRRAIDDVSVRPRERNGVSRPRHGESDHAGAQDEVAKADRIARDLGFGGRIRDDARDVTAGVEGDRLNRPAPTRRRDSHSAPTEGRPDRPELDRARLDRLERSRDAERPRDSQHRADRRDRNTDRRSDVPEDVGRFQFDTEIRERPRGRANELLQPSQLEQLLVHETAAADGLAKPYLSSLPDAYVAERLVFDWLEFLVLNGGYKRTMDALRYYHTVEWLTEDIEAELQDYLVAFSGEVSTTREYEVEDHHLSLVYIARLASMT
ncbi:FlaD/FlaE family flagellar protein [Halobellus rufus]|uniref:FlaD/FlaE family flagellar protein n=1 Tax=Halobellus rufus TaxID=1448860 RepID=UPI0009DCE7BD